MQKLKTVLVAAACLLAGGSTAWAAGISTDEISDAVHQDLTKLAHYTVFDYLSYSVNGTEVTLTGQVVDPQLKQDAAQAVQSIDGVTTVLNEIAVLPESPSDNAIRAAEYQSILGDPSLGRYGDPANPTIRIIVDRRKVTLEGIVAGQGDKKTAGAAAEAVPGVAQVNNNLLIEQGVSE